MGNTCSHEISCEFNFTQGAVVEFDGDPDIAGIGVIVSFLISAWFTFLLALFSYLFVENVLNKDDFFVTTFDLHVLKLADKVKEWAKQLVRALTGNRIRPLLLMLWPAHQRRFTKEQMQQVCLMAADQQLVAGAAILIVGYSRHCEITQYHFFIASLMTLCSFATFQAIVILVRDALDSHFKRSWRIVWITVIFGCVITNNFVVYNNNFLTFGHFGHSMECIWDAIRLGQEYTSRQVAYVSLGVMLDIWSYFTIVAYLNQALLDWPPVEAVLSTPWVILGKASQVYLSVRAFRQRHYPESRLMAVLESFVLAIFIMAFTIRELLFSLFIDLLRIFLYLFQVTVDVTKWRNLAGENGRKETENEWGFGQILPMLLLAIPLFAFLEIVYPAKKPTEPQTELRTLPATDEAAQPLPSQALMRRRTQVFSHGKLSAQQWWLHDFSEGGVEDLEASLYANNWFRTWLGVVAASGFVVGGFLAIYLTDGLPI